MELFVFTGKNTRNFTFAVALYMSLLYRKRPFKISKTHLGETT